MTFNRPGLRAWRQARGVSLVELLIAAGIGVVLLLGLVEIFGASRAAFATAEGASRVQENARFASDFMRRDIRMAGHSGLQNGRAYVASQTLYNHGAAGDARLNAAAAPFALRIDFPIQGFDFTGTDPGQAFDLSGGLGAAAAANFTPGLPPQLADLASDAVAGSDVLALRFLSGESVPSLSLNAATSSILVAPGDIGFFEADAVYGAATFRALSLFQALTVGASVNVGMGGLNLSPLQGDEGLSPDVHRYQYVVYYVGFDGVSGEPSLKQRILDPGRPNLLSAPLTLVEGVEALQFVYGVDTGAVLDDVPDQYQSAAGVNGLDATPQLSWQRVLNVRYSVLMRSAEPAAAVRDAGAPPLRVADTTFSVADDGRIRQVFESVASVRNRVRN
jgi:type IV pilus assembly protein PilW